MRIIDNPEELSLWPKANVLNPSKSSSCLDQPESAKHRYRLIKLNRCGDGQGTLCRRVKLEAVRQAIERGFSVGDVAKRLGVSAQSLHKWDRAV